MPRLRSRLFRRREWRSHEIDERKIWLAVWWHPHNEYDIGWGNAERTPFGSGSAVAATALVAAAAAVALVSPRFHFLLAFAGPMVGLVLLVWGVRALDLWSIRPRRMSVPSASHKRR